MRKFYYEGSYDYFEDRDGRPESREAQAAYRMELSNGDQWAGEFSKAFEHLEAPFQVTPGVIVPAGDYDFQQAKLLFTSSPQRPISGTLTLTYGGFYGGTLQELTWRGRVEFGPRFYAEPTVSLNLFETPYGRRRRQHHQLAAHLHADAAHVRVGARAVPVGQRQRQHQRPVPLGIPARQRVVRGLQRRPKHDRPRFSRVGQPEPGGKE